MSLKEFLIRALCVSVCLASSSSSNEEMAREFIERVLRIPNPDKVFNSVLGRLEKNRQHGVNRHPIIDKVDCDEPKEILPEYTESLQASHERDLRHQGTQNKHHPICPLKKEKRKLNTDEYEYRPAYYDEVICTMAGARENFDVADGICSSLGFSCVQWNKTIHLTRRRYSSDCWESQSMVIPAGCECMWPEHKLGEFKFESAFF